jgi:hypothetical protein
MINLLIMGITMIICFWIISFLPQPSHIRNRLAFYKTQAKKNKIKIQEHKRNRRKEKNNRLEENQ